MYFFFCLLDRFFSLSAGPLYDQLASFFLAHYFAKANRVKFSTDVKCPVVWVSFYYFFKIKGMLVFLRRNA